MPVSTTYPGVYIEEVPSGVRSIAGVATSITAFVGYTVRGRENHATRIFNFGDFERAFGGLASDSELSYAVSQYFSNGGTDAYVVRVPKSDAEAAEVSVIEEGAENKTSLEFTAISSGKWANEIIIDIDYDSISDNESFNITFTYLATGETEYFRKLSVNRDYSNFVERVINSEDNGSKWMSVSVPTANPGGRPAQSGLVGDNLVVDIQDKPTALLNDKDYTIKVTSDLPGGLISDLECTVIEVDESLPESVLGVCKLLERKLNLALRKEVPQMSVSCVPTHTGKGIRVQAVIQGDDRAYDVKLSFSAGVPNDADTILNLSTASANVSHYWPASARTVDEGKQLSPSRGKDGDTLPLNEHLIGKASDFSGIYALDKVDIFNLLCIPDATRSKAGNPSQIDGSPNPLNPNAVFTAALDYCKKRRAFLLIDPPPGVADIATATDWRSAGLTVRDPAGNAAAYFPRLKLPDPLDNFKLRMFAPCGVVAGLYARIDTARGVWKAPAGIEATLNGVQGLEYKLSDPENGVLNPLGLNCFRVFPVYGHVAWGARTLAGADASTSEWKYIPIRRLALFLEESLYRGTQWVVFEPNDEPLWSQIRLNVGSFMQGLFRQGAFQGSSPRDAYIVKCDNETTTQDDINNGIVNIVVGFAPLKPAEFVIIKIQQIAGQTPA